MKRLIWILMIVPLPLLCGCRSVWVKFNNLPIWTATANRTVITNMTKDLRFDVLRDGVQITESPVLPGEQYIVDLRNHYNSGEKTHLLTVVVRDCCGEKQGITERVIRVSSYEQDCRSWNIDSEEFRKRK